MTVFWVSVCRNDVEFFFISACRQKSAGQGHLKLKNFLARSSLYCQIEPDWRVMCEVDIFGFTRSLIRLVLHELFDLYIGKIDDRVLLGMYWWINVTIGG